MAANKPSAQFFRQPRYYNSFSCIGGSCPVSCCLTWRVDWTKDEVKKLKDADCSEHLKELIGSSFLEFGEKYIIKMDEKNRCPFLTEDNFCSIQRELGEEYLSGTCTTYPRGSRLSGNAILNYCFISCYHVMDTLCSDSECMILENFSPRTKKDSQAVLDSEMNILNHPELKYRREFFEFFYEVISDDSYSVETAVTLGAVAAQSMSKLIDNGAYDKIPDNISALKKQLKNPAQIKKLEELKPNYSVKLGFAQEVNRTVIRSDAIDIITENGAVNIDKYNYGMQKFYEYFADRPFVMRNIALNLLLELNMPFRDLSANLFENYCYFVAALSMYKMFAASAFLGNNNPYKIFLSASSRLSRFFAHDKNNVKPIINLFKELNCASPAYIALILK